MENKYKARVYSLLVFPGAGHFILRHWWRGILFLVPFLWALAVVTYFITTRAVDLMQLILEGKIEPEFAALYQALHEQSAAGSLPYTIALVLLVATWLLAAVDVWIISNRD